MLSPSAEAVLAKYEARRAAEDSLPDETPADDLLLSIGPQSGALVHALVRSSGATRILELGASYGYSTLFLADAAARTGGRVTTMDLISDKQSYARAMLAEAGLDTLVDWRTGDAVALIEADPGPFDFVLLDVWKDMYPACLKAFHGKLAEGGIVVADNMLYPEGALAAARVYRKAVAKLPDMTSTLLAVGSGLEVSCRWRNL